MIKFLSFILILINLSLSPAKALNENFRFIVLGHLYPISSNQDIIDKLSLKIENYNPNIIFILGDSSIDDPKTKKMYEKKFKAKIFYVPGNQELKSNRNKYLQNVGYLNKTFIMNDLKFLLINSSDDIKNIKNYLIENLNQDFDQDKTFIMTHHRIWDDSIVDSKPFSHDKSYYFKEILPLISNKVSTIFAGNSKRQYFRDLSDHTGYGKHNTNLIYWYDKVGNITYYDSSNGNEYGFTKPYSEKTAETIDKEISSIIEKEYQRAIKLLQNNKSKLVELAEVLLDKEVIFKDNLEKIFGKRPFDKEVINS